ncbi:MAG: hypothetical protein COB56_08265 [Robiginitomaculum sp.]|nr:MAG: hypothetical protein COB56_08265 [Robiginitomaculum sp.]
MKLSNYLLGSGTIIAALTLSACQPAKPDVELPPTETPATEVEAPKLTENYPTKLLWGDTHLHTLNSADAFSFGARLSPADAYKFARGDEIVSNTGQKVQLKRPLDFLVVADHAEGLGLINELFVGNPKLIKDPKAKRWHEMLNEGTEQSVLVGKELIVSHANKTLPKTMRNPFTVLPLLRSIWKRSTALAEEFNDPGTFTALIGYEYTSMPDGNNIHRNVIFRDGNDKTDKIMPFSSIQSDNPEDLWKWMARYEKKTGGQVLAIPHNSNLSNGLMFAKTDFKGNAIDAKYAQKRARWEPVVEITQIKGDSESHPFLSPNDEFSSFGDVGWDLGNLSLQATKEPEMFQGDYVREALKTGLGLEASTGTNPFKLGFIGSTDSHTGLATGREENFFGKFGVTEPHKERVNEIIVLGGAKALRYGWQYLAGGYAGVWARGNTRAEIWDALKRKEVYGTTGPRMKVRFFGGNYDKQSINTGDLVDTGYAGGVPMGGDLQLSQNQSPDFIVAASKDPDGANLDRVQIIKGWRDVDGGTHEKIYDVAWAGERTIGADGKLPAIGSTVDTDNASYENSIGAAELLTIWTDPGFDPAQAAFYYVRVLEIPTPRWPLFDAKRMGADIPDDAELTAQERAYTSPIWYTPK